MLLPCALGGLVGAGSWELVTHTLPGPPSGSFCERQEDEQKTCFLNLKRYWDQRLMFVKTSFCDRIMEKPRQVSPLDVWYCLVLTIDDAWAMQLSIQGCTHLRRVPLEEARRQPFEEDRGLSGAHHQMLGGQESVKNRQGIDTALMSQMMGI